jgi:hypothetical protein
MGIYKNERGKMLVMKEKWALAKPELVAGEISK